MNKNVWIGIIVVALAVFLVWFGLGGEDVAGPKDNTDNTKEVESELESAETGESESDTVQEENDTQGTMKITYNVTYTEEGFGPADINVHVGETVTFINKGDLEMWPASNVHPTHTVYPGSDIKKCFDGSDTSSLFDSCGVVETYTFTFNKPGQWSYHNHKRASHGGTITVTE